MPIKVQNELPARAILESENIFVMDEKYRIVLLLYYGEGFKIKEIAQILEMDENTVKTRLSRGRKKFEHAYSMC